MRNVVLADTGPLYAASDPDDSRHGRSLEEQERLEAEGLEMVVSYATLQESYNLILRKLGLSQTRAFLEDLARTAIFVTPTEDDYRGAIRRVLRYSDQDISLADALLAEVSHRLEAPVWTYDHHFDVMGARVWRP
ncbi:MAG: PIN domain-containing protein [Rubrobacter sp.]|nr:PIN domain-containing protein [Rubrobacter sp.]